MFSMVIYNRWGQVIFETTNPAEGWDGKDAPAGFIAGRSILGYGGEGCEDEGECSLDEVTP